MICVEMLIIGTKSLLKLSSPSESYVVVMSEIPDVG